MRTLRLFVFSAFAALFMGGNLSPAVASTLDVTVLDAKTVVVRGASFPEERLLVSVDMDMPHASVACHTDFTRVAFVKDGGFEATINPGKCDFRCGREPSGYLVAVETLAGVTVATAKFACVAPRLHPRK